MIVRCTTKLEEDVTCGGTFSFTGVSRAKTWGIQDQLQCALCKAVLWIDRRKK